MDSSSSGKDSNHYSNVSENYDKFSQFMHKGTVNLIKQYIPLKPTDTIMEIGGGTGEVIVLLKKEFGIESPGICIEPNKEMIEVAGKKEGIIPINATAEEYFAQNADHSINLVILSGMVHYLSNLPDAIEKVAELIKSTKGTCLISRYPFPEEVWFEAALKKFRHTVGTNIPDICKELGGLECLYIEWNECYKIKKDFWYESLRGRCVSTLSYFTDEEIEAGIAEVEKKNSDVDELNYNLIIRGWIITSI